MPRRVLGVGDEASRIPQSLRSITISWGTARGRVRWSHPATFLSSCTMSASAEVVNFDAIFGAYTVIGQVLRYSVYVGMLGEFFTPGCRHEVNVSSETRRLARKVHAVGERIQNTKRGVFAARSCFLCGAPRRKYIYSESFTSLSSGEYHVAQLSKCQDGKELRSIPYIRFYEAEKRGLTSRRNLRSLCASYVCVHVRFTPSPCLGHTYIYLFPQLIKFCDWVASSEQDKRKLFDRAAQEVSTHHTVQ